MTTNEIYFSATDVAARLKTLRASKDGVTGWWTAALEFEWQEQRSAANCKWINVFYTDAAGVKSRLNLRILGEKNTGRIMPVTDEGLQEMVAASAKGGANSAKFEIKKREFNPSLSIMKWNTTVKTAPDGISLTLDADGKPVLPGDDALSPYYQVAEMLTEAFEAEASERVERGGLLMRSAKQTASAAVKSGAAFAADTFMAQFNAEHAPRRAGDAIVTLGDVVNLRKIITSETDMTAILRGVITAPVTKITPMLQLTISDNAKANAGKLMSNPITRITLGFDKDTGVAGFNMWDKRFPFKTDKGKTAYEIAKVDDVPVNVNNVHKFVQSGCIIDGMVNLGNICISSLAISIPAKAKAIVVAPRAERHVVSIDDIYGDSVETVTAGVANTQLDDSQRELDQYAESLGVNDDVIDDIAG